MKEPDIRKIRKAMEKALDPKRYEHTLGVAYTAAALAMRYGDDVNNAILAGMLHDCAKCLTNEKRLSICEKYNIAVNEAERKNPYLLHAKVGSFLAMKKYGVTDKDVINAILNHTTGKPAMSLLDKIVYVADYIEPRRNKAPNLTEVRKLAFLDLDEALYKILSDTLEYLDEGSGEIDQMTMKAYEYYKAKRVEQESRRKKEENL